MIHKIKDYWIAVVLCIFAGQVIFAMDTEEADLKKALADAVSAIKSGDEPSESPCISPVCSRPASPEPAVLVKKAVRLLVRSQGFYQNKQKDLPKKD